MSLSEKNWRITRLGAIAVAVLSAAYIYAVMEASVFDQSLVLAAASGAFYAVASRLAGAERFGSMARPVSSFLSMTSGVLLIAAAAVFTQSSFEVLSALVTLDQGISTILLSVFTTLVGAGGLILGSYFIMNGVILVLSEKLDEGTPVGPQSSDLVFTGILIGVTVLSVAGTAFLTDLEPGAYITALLETLIAPETVPATVTGLIFVTTYFISARAWRSLPFSELVPSDHSDTYGKLARVEQFFRFLAVPVIGLLIALNDSPEMLEAAVLGGLDTPGFREFMLYLIFASILAFVGVKVIQAFTGDREWMKSLAPYLLFTGLAWLIAPYVAIVLDVFASTAPELIATPVEEMLAELGQRNTGLVFLTAASGLSFLLKSFTGLLKGLGFVSEGLEGTGFSAFGVLSVALGLYIFQASPSSVLLFTGVALSMVVWEIGRRSTVLGMEVGREGASMQGEFVQVLLKLAVALIAIVAAETVLVLLSQVGTPAIPGSVALMVFLLAVSGVLLVSMALKDFL